MFKPKLSTLRFFSTEWVHVRHSSPTAPLHSRATPIMTHLIPLMNKIRIKFQRRMSPFWIILELKMIELVSGDNWSYKTCKAPVKSSPPTNQHPTFYRSDALPLAKQTVSEHWRANREQNMHLLNSTSDSIFPAGVLWQPIHYLQRDSEAGSVWKHPELWGWGTLTETWHLGCRWQTHALVELSQHPWTGTSNRQTTVICTIDPTTVICTTDKWLW